MRQNKNVTIGVTGNSGSGKGEVCNILKNEKGAVVIDADEIAHEILLPGLPAYNEVAELFGAAILTQDGEIDRRKVAGIIFADGEMRKKHTDITHRYIKAEILKRLDEYKKSDANVIVIDAALLIESGLDKICDYVWLVEAGYDTKLSRITVRDNIPADLAKSRLNAQNSAYAADCRDYVIDNNGTMDELKDAVLAKLR